MIYSNRKIWNDGPALEDFMGREGAPPIARRHLANGGGKSGGGGGTTTQQSTTTIPPEVLARYNAVNKRAETAAEQPFQQYTGQFVAPINPTQGQAIGNISNITGQYQPYYNAATASTIGGAAAGFPYFGAAGQNIDQAQAGAQPYQQLATQYGLAGTQSVNPSQLQPNQYMSPYIQSVVAPTMASLYQQQQQQQSQLQGQQAMQGAFGGDRGQIGQANLAQQQGLAAAQTQGNLYNQAYNNALAASQQQQGVGLQAGQANRAALQQFAPQALAIGQQGYGQNIGAAQARQGLGTGIIGAGTNVGQALGNIGQGMTQTGLAANQSLLAGGTLGQQTQQAANTALYNQFQQQQGYPFQVAQFLANIAEGTGALSGSSTSGTTQSPTSFFSDERLKENIVEVGRTHDGQKIIKFNYKGDPDKKQQIGLSAQDVEKHHPEAVGLAGGYKTVDYDAATKDAEVHRAFGGLVPQSMGGAVEDTGLRANFATSGTVGSSAADEILAQMNLKHREVPGGFGAPYRSSKGYMPPSRSGTQRKLLSNQLPQLPRQEPTGLAQGLNAIQGGVGAVDTAGKIKSGGEGIYNEAREWAVGAPARPAVPATSTTSARDAVKGTQGLFGTAGKGGPTGILNSPSTAPASTAPASATPTSIVSAPAPPGISIASITPSEYGGGLIPLDNFSMSAAHGGRIGYSTSGSVPMPYNDAEGYVPETEDDKDKENAANFAAMNSKTPPASGGVGGGGPRKDQTASTAMKAAGLAANFIPGVGPFISAGLNIGSMFVKDGGRIGYATDGAVHDMNAAKRAIAGVESGGNYGAIGPVTKGDRPYGKYQVMGANLPSWTQEALGRRLTPEEFLRSPEAQERVFEHHFGKELNKYGNLADAASVWHSGRPFAVARADNARDVNMSTEEYVRRVLGGHGPSMESRAPSEASSRGAGLASSQEHRPAAGLAPLEASERAGLSPHFTDFEPTEFALLDTGEDFELPDRFNRFNRFATGEDFELPDRFNRFNRFATGGRAGYQTDGTVVPPELWSVDQTPADLERNVMTEKGIFNERGPGNGRVPPNQSTTPAFPPYNPVTSSEGASSNAMTEQEKRERPHLDQDALESLRLEVEGNKANARGLAPLPPTKYVGAGPGGNGVENKSDVVTARAGLGGNGVANKPDVVTARTPELTATTNPDLFDRVGGFLDRNQNGLLAGLSGIGKALSSRSPYLLGSLGEGLVEGATAYPALQFKQQSLDMTMAGNLYKLYNDNNARIASVQAIAARNGRTGPLPELAPLIKQNDYLAQKISDVVSKWIPKGTNNPAILGRISAPGATAPAPGGTTPALSSTSLISAIPVEPPPNPATPVWARRAGITPDEQKWLQEKIDPAREPDNLRRAASDISYISPETAQKLIDEANTAQDRYDKGEIPVKGGGYATMPGWARMQQQKNNVIKNNDFMSTTYAVNLAGYQQTFTNIDEMTSALKNLETGADAGVLNHIAKRIERYTGVSLPFNATNPAEYDKFKKGIYQAVASQLKTMGGAPSDARLDAIANGSPNAELTIEANKEIIGYLQATAKWMNDRDDYLKNQISEYGTHIDPAGALSDWMKNPKNNLSARAQAATKEIVAKGDFERAKERNEFVDGQNYLLPNIGPRRARITRSPNGSSTIKFE